MPPLSASPRRLFHDADAATCRYALRDVDFSLFFRRLYASLFSCRFASTLICRRFARFLCRRRRYAAADTRARREDMRAMLRCAARHDIRASVIECACCFT